MPQQMTAQQGQAQRIAQGRPPMTQRDMEAVRQYLMSQGMAGNFARATRQSILTQPAFSFSSGLPVKLDLPQTGFLADIFALFVGTTTTGAASSTTLLNYIPPPLGIANRIHVFSNQGVDIWSAGAWATYLSNKTEKYRFEPIVEEASEFNYSNAFGNSRDPFTRYFQSDAALGASASQNWRFSSWLPIAWGPSAESGLQLLQDPAIRYSFEVTWGTLASLYSATTGTVTISATCLPTVVLYHAPERAIDLPKLSYTRTVLEDQQALLSGSGDNVYKFVTGNIATKVILEHVNAPAGVQTPIFPNGTTLANSTNPVTRTKLRYSQTQIPYDMDADTQLFRQRWLYGQDLPGGVYVHELSMPNGLPELVGVRDVLNTARLTDLDLITTLSGVTLTNGFTRGIRHQLVKNR